MQELVMWLLPVIDYNRRVIIQASSILRQFFECISVSSLSKLGGFLAFFIDGSLLELSYGSSSRVYVYNICIDRKKKGPLFLRDDQ